MKRLAFTIVAAFVAAGPFNQKLSRTSRSFTC